MIRHYWKTALRNLLRNKLFSSINIIGLSVSIAIFLTLNAYVRYQLSYDTFYKDGDRIYRIDYYEYQGDEPVLKSARTHDRTSLLVNDYAPQVEAVARVYNEKAYIYNDETRLVDQNMLFVDSSFFRVFTIHLIEGSPETALVPPNAVVISKSQARIYFGDKNPIGKTLYFNERLPITVTGVFEDIPENSSLDFDFLISWSTMTSHGWISKEGSFNNPWVFTFVKLRDTHDVAGINKELTKLVTDNNTELKNRRHTAKQELRPYHKLHLFSGLSGEIKPGINSILLYSLISLALFILVAAWINYINLSLARSLERADEIGVRKVFGASRTIISGQFLVEGFILAGVTFLIGLGLFDMFTGPLASPLFTTLTFASPNTFTLVLYFIIVATGTMLASVIPAHFISKFKPLFILNNKLGSGKGHANFLHQSLLVFQLFLAVAVVGITLVTGKQISYMRTSDMGFNATHAISLRGPASTNSDSLRSVRYRAFRNEVLQNPVFQSGTASMNIPGEEIRFHDENVHPVGSINEKKQSFKVMLIDEGYPETFGVTLLGGRNLNAEERGQTCVINETAAHALGFNVPTDAINTSFINQDNKPTTIVGVWQDYHHESLHKPVEPIIFYYAHPFEYGYYSFRVQPQQSDYLNELETIWKKHYPDDTFNYYFMDQFFAEQYQADQSFSTLMNLFSIISIMVACLGLFGMATLSIVKRAPEIGVRKVLGASVWNILALLSKNYIKLIAISCGFAFPVAYYLTNEWLNGFAYRIEIEWWMIIVPGIIVLAATLATISSQSIRAAMANPAKTLKEH